MSILTSVSSAVKRNEKGTQLSAGEEKKMLSDINKRIEDLQQQNLENARFLRTITRKIQDDLDIINKVEENRAIEVYDDSKVVASIENVEKSLQEINNREVLEAIDNINNSINEMNSDELIAKIEQVNKNITTINNEGANEEIKAVINESKLDIESDIIEIKESLESSIKDSENNLSKSTEEKISESHKDILNEIHRVESLCSERGDSAILTEIDRLRKLINEKNSEVVINEFDDKIKRLSPKDYTGNFIIIEDEIKSTKTALNDVDGKLGRVTTMPSMIKTIVETKNTENNREIKAMIEESADIQKIELNGYKTMTKVNLFISIATFIMVILRILGKI